MGTIEQYKLHTYCWIVKLLFLFQRTYQLISPCKWNQNFDEKCTGQKRKTNRFIHLHFLIQIEEEVQMEVDPPKDEANAAEAGAPAAEGGEKEPSKNEDAEMKEEDSKADPKAAEDPAKKEYRTEKRKKVISKTIDLPVTSIVVGAMSRDKLDAAVEQEKVLVNQDTYEGNRYVF